MKKLFTSFLLAFLLFLLVGMAGLFGVAAYQRYVKNEQERAARQAELLQAQEDPEAGGDALGVDPASLAAGIDGVPRGDLAYQTLNEEDRQTYKEMLYAMENHLEEIRLTTLDETRIEVVYQALTCDYGGLFWVNGYTYTQKTLSDEVTDIYFKPNYLFDEEDRQLYQGYVDETVEDYFAQLSPGATDYEKVKYVYEMLIYNVEYNLEIDENQNILSVFLFGESVCSGFANAAQYMLTLLDVPCMNVYGYSQGEPHAWNLAYIDGEPYFLDVTWGNTASKSIGECCYNFLNVSSRDLEKTHQIDMDIDVPECTAVDANYFVREGRFFTVMDEPAISAVFRTAYDSGERTVSVKLASDSLYRETFDYYITEKHISDACPGLSSIQYVENQEMRVLTLMW